MITLKRIVVTALLGVSVTQLPNAEAGGQCSKGGVCNADFLERAGNMLPGKARPKSAVEEPSTEPPRSHSIHVQKDIEGNVMQELHFDKNQKLIQINGYDRDGNVRSIDEFNKNGKTRRRVTRYEQDGSQVGKKSGPTSKTGSSSNSRSSKKSDLSQSSEEDLAGAE